MGKNMNHKAAIMDSVQEQLASIEAVDGRKSALLVSIGITSLSIITHLEAVDLFVEQAGKNNAPPDEVIYDFKRNIATMLAVIASVAADIGDMSDEEAQESMRWAKRITTGAESTLQSMKKGGDR
jgi:hypothetical protein